MLYIFTTVIIVFIAIVLTVYLGRSYFYETDAAPPTSKLEENASVQKAMFDAMNRSYETDDTLLLKQDRLVQDFKNTQRIFDIENKKYHDDVAEYVREVAKTNSNLSQRLQDKHRETTHNIFQQQEQINRYLKQKMGPYSNIHHMYEVIGYDKDRDMFQAYDYEVIDDRGEPIVTMRNLHTQMNILTDLMDEKEDGIASNFTVINVLKKNIEDRCNVFYNILNSNQVDINLYAQTFCNDLNALQKSVQDYVDSERDIWKQRMDQKESQLKNNVDQAIFDTTNVFQRLAFESQTKTMNTASDKLSAKVLELRQRMDNASSDLRGTYVNEANRIQSNVASNLSNMITTNVRAGLSDVNAVALSNQNVRLNVVQQLDSTYIKMNEFEQYIIDQDVRSNVYTSFVFDSLRSNNNTSPSLTVYASDLRTSNSNVTFRNLDIEFTTMSNLVSSKLNSVNATSTAIEDRGINASNINIHKWRSPSGTSTRMELGKSKWQSKISGEVSSPHLEIDRDIRISDIYVNGKPLVNQLGRFNGGGEGQDSISFKIEALHSNLSQLATKVQTEATLNNLSDTNHTHEDLNLYQLKLDPSYVSLSDRIINMSNACGSTAAAPCLHGSNLVSDIKFYASHFGPNALSWSNIDWRRVSFPPEIKDSIRGTCVAPPGGWEGKKVDWSSGYTPNTKVPFSNANLQNIPFSSLNVTRSNLLKRLSISTSDLTENQFDSNLVSINSSDDLGPLTANSLVKTVQQASQLESAGKIPANRIPKLQQGIQTLSANNIYAQTATFGSNQPMVFMKQGKDCFAWNGKIICDPKPPTISDHMLFCYENQPGCQLQEISYETVSNVLRPYINRTVMITNTSQEGQYFENVPSLLENFEDCSVEQVPTVEGFNSLGPIRIGSVRSRNEANGCIIDQSRDPSPGLLTHAYICNLRTQAQKVSNTTHTYVQSNVTLPLTNINASCQSITQNNFAEYVSAKNVNQTNLSISLDPKDTVRGNPQYILMNPNPPSTILDGVNVRYTATNCPTVSCTIPIQDGVLFDTTSSAQDYMCGLRQPSERTLTRFTTSNARVLVKFDVQNQQGMSLTSPDVTAACSSAFNSMKTTIPNLPSMSGVTFASSAFNNVQCTPYEEGGRLQCRVTPSGVTVENCSVGRCENNGEPVTSYEQINGTTAIPIPNLTEYCANNPGSNYRRKETQEQVNLFTGLRCDPIVSTVDGTCAELKYTINTAQSYCFEPQPIGSTTNYVKFDHTVSVDTNPKSGTLFSPITISPNETTEFTSSYEFYRFQNNILTKVNDANTLKRLPFNDRSNYYIKMNTPCANTCSTSTYRYNADNGNSAPYSNVRNGRNFDSSWFNVDNIKNEKCTGNSSTPIQLSYEETDCWNNRKPPVSLSAQCIMEPCTISMNNRTYNLHTQSSEALNELNNNCYSINPTLSCPPHTIDSLFTVNNNQFALKSGVVLPKRVSILSSFGS